MFAVTAERHTQNGQDAVAAVESGIRWKKRSVLDVQPIYLKVKAAC
jgi:hypothetical protein